MSTEALMRWRAAALPEDPSSTVDSVQCDGAGELGLDGLSIGVESRESIGVESREQLAGSRLQALVSYDDDLTRQINPRSLQDSNEVPFYQHRGRSAWDVHICRPSE
jgi:hypothetical protein